ncbi:hypothetical protein A0H76_982 [Hepatospora eriocheir]|uniref:Uncharacterized protein n=1 Tax=Hepatospora eriocheir TaxID=1081669 RepID=A0A1X0QI70_9MICR|nr:hypothetical protein A0H76_982 [Hepatospora eriocheir]
MINSLNIDDTLKNRTDVISTIENSIAINKNENVPKIANKKTFFKILNGPLKNSDLSISLAPSKINKDPLNKNTDVKADKF